MAELIYRHNRITRLIQWVNAVALLILFMSGLQIFNAFPELHWGVYVGDSCGIIP
jgi:cytochrome b subunit of formate dehydrogenase